MTRRPARITTTSLCVVAVLVTGCVPSQRGEVAEVGSPSPTTAPALDVTELDATALVEVLATDLAARPADLDTWAPSAQEAACAASAVVGSVGADRLVALGYRPSTPGSALADLAWSAEEEQAVEAAFAACVDANEAVARILLGRGRMAPLVATCMADGLERTGQLEVVVAAAALGRPLDPFADDGALARALSAQADICIPEAAFDWPDLRLPDPEPVLDLTAPAGTRGSRFADDHTTTEPAP